MHFLAVHGHFYQPRRDDPATGEIPPEFGAEPFANWNEKIADECYRPNAELKNYELLSFDFGPTLLSWLKLSLPKVHRALAAADRASVTRFGAGGAMAQSYHHSILPLATAAEKELELAWGIRDFEHRFGRKPRGLWLPETAADRATLRAAVDQGIEYTVLAPWQAAEQPLDPSRPYWIELGGGRRIAAFFFVRSLSGRVSFDPQATNNADAFAREHLLPIARRLRSAKESRLVLIATDGELYGHHQKGREFFLRHLLRQAAPRAGFEVTNLAHYLDLHPPTEEVELLEPSSWSCHHGIERWVRTCPCGPDSTWKEPLRRAFDRLAADLDRAYAEAASELVSDPRAFLLASIDLVLGQVPLPKLSAAHAVRKLKRPDLARLAALLHAQRLRHRMYSSCGWFWDDLDRIEPRNCLRAAAVAHARLRHATGTDPAPWLLDELAEIKSQRTGASADQVVREEWGRMES